MDYLSPLPHTIVILLRRENMTSHDIPVYAHGDPFPPILFSFGPPRFRWSGLPPCFKLPLADQEGTEGNIVVLRCELTKPAASVEWRRGEEPLCTGDKYHMRVKELQAELKILDLAPEDTGDYSCVCGEHRTTARLTVNGERDDHSRTRSILLKLCFTA